ncbi:MAG: TIR domain-containing protein [Actinobacteria bacterium]|nr:TIR domain-containing protein [Actinomycetota bacterium]
MADPRAFISFDFDNNEDDKILFAGQCSKKSPTPFSAQDWSSKTALPQRTWQQVIHEKIGRCHVMFVLVSPTAHRATGVAKEIQMAVEQDVPYYGVYVNGADSSTPLPAGLKRSRTVVWRWSNVAEAVDSMMSEGKNA